jgi:hypothetical protein
MWNRGFTLIRKSQTLVKKVFGRLIYNCANWVRYLEEMGKLDDILWVANDDSHAFPADYSIPRTAELKEACFLSYDLVFICKSSPWCTPHLDHKWLAFIAPLTKNLLDEEVNIDRVFAMDYYRQEQAELLYENLPNPN